MHDQNYIPPANGSPSDPQRAEQLLQQMLWLHEHEVDCEQCADNMNCLADLVVAGRSAKAALPAVYAHIRCCPHCAEVYEALITVLLAEQAGELGEIGS
jgi:hypothetical protein